MTGDHGLVGVHVNGERLWTDLMTLAQFGAREDGGVCRHALSAEDIAARDWLTGIAAERGYAVSVDEAANLFIRRGGRDETLAPVLTGSHMDSQPAGGKFDGAYGVLAGLEVLRALDDAGVKTERPVDVVAWTNEEGGRFFSACTGSRAFAEGAVPSADQKDADGVTLADALQQTLAAAPEIERRALGGQLHAYLEAHIEQGPLLEREDVAIGVVSGIQGVRWYEVGMSGVPGHAGTVPMAGREDAFQAAHRAIHALNELMADPDDRVRFTVGRVNIEPNSPNTIPARATFTIDFRHPEASVLAERAAHIPDLIAQAALPCQAQTTLVTSMEPVDFPEQVTSALGAAADGLGVAHRVMPSGAFHDASHIAPVAPSGMLFIPCRGGLSHHPDEWAEPEWCEQGARVLADALARLARD